MALLLLFYWFCGGLPAAHWHHYARLAQGFTIEKFGGERNGFFDIDLSAFRLAVGNVGQMDSDQGLNLARIALCGHHFEDLSF